MVAMGFLGRCKSALGVSWGIAMQFLGCSRWLLYSCYSVWMFLGVLLCNYYGIPVWLHEVFVWGIAMQLLGCSRWLLRHFYVVARVFLVVLGVLLCSCYGVLDGCYGITKWLLVSNGCVVRHCHAFARVF